MSHRGFTLIEVIVALTIGSAVVLMVHHTFGDIIASSARLEADQLAHDQERRAYQILTRAVGSLDVRQSGFAGGAERLRFSTVVSGISESVDLGLAGGYLVLASGQRRDSLLPVAAIRADYLLSSGAQSRWLSQWQSPSSAPVLIRLLLERDSLRTDTLLLRVGSRG